MDRIKVILSGICSLILTVGIARFAYTPLLPIMREQAHLTEVTGGWLAAFNYAGYISGILLSAAMSQAHHKYIFFRITLVLAIFTTLGMGFTTNPIVWGALRYVSGVCSVAGLIQASGMVLGWLTANGYQKELGLHFSGMGLGILLSGIVCIALEQTVRWDGLWVIFGLLSLVFFVPAWFWMPRPANPVTNATQVAAAAPVSNKWFGIMVAAYFCAGVGYVISATFIVDILKRLATFANQGALVWIVVGLAAAPSSFLWDRVSRQLGQIPTLMIAYLLQVFAVLIPAFSESSLPNLVGAAIFGSTFIGIVSLTLNLIGNKYPQNPAKAMARLTLSYGAAQILAPIMSGYIVTLSGSYTWVLYITAAMMTLGTLLLVWLHQHNSTVKI
ncbi:Predicted arabinose efflux permease, MFS family [Flexibacter flexilis DSM 6793]|uniref:Predicted arabinose efflux permease, MFS family n=1 Tax=Flexibacter flexilis DSM 6793 TaxID=927664 RepID=A0A1I1DJN4_9BACT|nr:YbfB/YjiJ family MFS transporter [Flexibacter flexilis]SFB75121.1 Predicted arabinose efflux permease, MFS family [Flexibacter flexilis DSM 6793]